MVGDGGRGHPNDSPDATLHVVTGPPWRWRQELPAWPSPPVGVVGADSPLALAAPTATALEPATIDPPPTSGAPFSVLAPLVAPVLLASRPLTLTLDASAWVTAGWLDPARGWLTVTADVHADAEVPGNRQHTRAVSFWQRAADSGWHPFATDDPALRRHILAQLTSPTFPWDDWTIRRCFADSARLLTKGLVWETVGGPVPTTADALAGWAPWVDAAGLLHVVREVQPPDGVAPIRLRAMVRWLTNDRDLAVILLHRLDEQRVLARARYVWAAHCAPVTRRWTPLPLTDARVSSG